MMRTCIAALIGFCTIGSIAAEEMAADEGGGLFGWTGTLDLGYLASSGNTEAETLHFSADASREIGSWTHNLYLQALNSSDTGTRSAERYLAGYKLDRAFTEHSYMFGRVELERDHFGGVSERNHLAVGYGRKLITGDIHRLNLEVAGGMNDLEFSDGTTNDEFLISFAGDYWWQATDSTTFTQRIRYDAGEDNDYAESETALSVAISTHLALSLSYLIKYNSTTPLGTESTDTYTAVSLSISF